jgi:cytochrome c
MTGSLSRGRPPLLIVLVALLALGALGGLALMITHTPGKGSNAPQVASSSKASVETRPSPTATPAIDWDTALAGADLQAGQAVAAKCTPCHSVDVDGPTIVGPPLWGIVGGKVAGVPGFPYSLQLRLFGLKHPTWTYQPLSDYIAAPSGTVPGTKMTFYGVKTARDRTNLIAYLRSLGPADGR